MSSQSDDRLMRWALLLVLLLAAALRLQGIGFGLPALNDPDELMFELGAVRMLRGLTLNPGWFGHPATTTMDALAIVNALVFLVGRLLGWFPSVRAFSEMLYADPSWVILPGRLLMMLFGLGTVLLTYRLGTDLHGRKAGLLAAALLAVNPVHITYSQIIRSDMMATFFMLLVLRAAVRISHEDRRRDHVLAALWVGAAVATKWPFAVSALAIFGAIGLRAWSSPETWRRAMRRAVLFGLMSIGFLILISPYLLLDHATLVRNLHGEAQPFHLGATGGSPVWNALWYLRGPLLGSFGPVAALFILLGLALQARRLEAAAILGPVTLVFFVLIACQALIWERWALPLLPILSISGGVAIIWLWERLRIRAGAIGPLASATLAIAITVAVALPPLIAARTKAIERTNDTRQLASAWARGHIPAGGSVLIEHFAFDMVQQPWHFLFPLANAGCVDAKAMLRGKIPYSTVDQNRGNRSNVDYGTMPAALRQTCRTDYAILTQYDRYRAEQGHFPTEFANYAWLIRQGKVVATFAPRAGVSGGPIVRIVQFGHVG